MSDGRRSEKALEVRWSEIGRALDEVGLAMSGYRSLAVDVTGVSIRAPQAQGGDFLLTVRGMAEDGAPVVAFHGSPDLGEAFRGLQNRLMNGSLKWRPDTYR
jgi:hypothetical protein